MFSFLSKNPIAEQISCGITFTNEKTTRDHRKKPTQNTAMYGGHIDGAGPRYCPSIEDKIDRFSDKLQHQVFVEPEGWNTHEVYVNGFSTSLPHDIQFKALRSVKGFESVKFLRPGYAIEYDYIDPRCLKQSLELKKFKTFSLQDK